MNSDVTNYSMDWQLLAGITGILVAGILPVHWMSTKIPAAKLKKSGWFVTVMGMSIIVKMLLFLGKSSH